MSSVEAVEMYEQRVRDFNLPHLQKAKDSRVTVVKPFLPWIININTLTKGTEILDMFQQRESSELNPIIWKDLHNSSTIPNRESLDWFLGLV